MADPKYDWPQLAQYWKAHSRSSGAFDPARDPEGLNNVCQSGAPLAVNRYYARGQRRAFESLLALVPETDGRRALDVGCGTGRWCRLLSRHGFSVTGIDLQDGVIAGNRTRVPEAEFNACAVQDFRTQEPFDLVTSVTVLQHLPHPEQERAVAAITAAVGVGGHALVLENVSDDQSAVVFPRSPAGWSELFSAFGFELASSLRYDYSPALRSWYALTARGRRQLASTTRKAAAEPGPVGTPTGVLKSADRMVRVGAALVDSLVDPVLARWQPPFSTAHAAMLLQKRGATQA